MLPNLKSVVREKERDTWLDELAKLCEERFEQDYRGLGVRNFYKTKLRARKEHLREIRRRVEDDLFTDWKNGVRSASDTSRLVAALIEYTSERAQLFDERITKTKELQGEAATRVKANNQAWSQMNKVSKLTGKPEEHLRRRGGCPTGTLRLSNSY